MNWNERLARGPQRCLGSAHEGQAGYGAAPASWDYIKKPLRYYQGGGDGGGLDRRLAFGPSGPLSDSEGPFSGRRIGTLRRDGKLRMFSVDHVTSFIAGTRLRTPGGLRRIEELRPGDKVMTLDNGPCEVTWTGRRTVRAGGRFAPILIRPGALGNRHPVLVSPSQHLVLKDSAVRMLFGRDEAVVAARHLLDGERIIRSPRPQTEYVLLQMDGYQVLDEGDLGLECAEPLTICALDEAMLARPLAPDAARRAELSLKMARGDRVGLSGYESRLLRSMMAATADLLPALGRGSGNAFGLALS
ncbi:Hint domain-containing protein [Pseudooceanicola sp. 200-1SW]|uniref:Hint domain-containing protein n=1 Tax=Pseudooceanicola sp. 200-1SW TaxID=3425949 RepID=UPI003D7F9EC5